MFLRLTLLLLLLCFQAIGQSKRASFSSITYSGKIAKTAILDFERSVLKTAQSESHLQQLVRQWQSRHAEQRFRVSFLGPEYKKYVYIQNDQLGNSLRNMAVTRGGSLAMTDALACVFADTLLVPDTLLVLPQGTRNSDKFQLRTGTNTYPLRRNARQELQLTANHVPELTTGKYIPVAIDWIVDNELRATWRCSLYLFSAQEQQALRELATTLYVDESISCDEASNELSQYLRGIRGGKQCASAALYDSALRNSLRRFIRNQTQGCR